MAIKYESWHDHDNDSISLSSAKEARREKRMKIIGPRSKLLWSFTASTFEEAMSIQNLRCGYAPYNPIGQAEECSVCGSYYYPNGSAECWKCKDKKDEKDSKKIRKQKMKSKILTTKKSNKNRKSV